MTFDDDLLVLEMSIGRRNIPLVKVGLEWPPPERIFFAADGRVREATDGDDELFVLERTSMSLLTDEERADMAHVIRGATYEYVGEVRRAAAAGRA